MKKDALILIISILGIINISVNAQTLEFVRNGQVVPNGTTIEITEPIDAGTANMKMDAEILINNPGTESVKAILTINVLEGESMAFCGFDSGIIGQCIDVSVNKPITKPLKGTVVQPEKTIKSGESIDPQVHTITMIENYNPLTFKTSFVSTVKYELSYGTTTKTVTVKYNYNTSNENINTRTLKFVRNGQVLSDGATIEITEPIDAGTANMKMDAEILINNPGTESVEAILTINVLEGESMAFCGFDSGIIGQCIDVSVNKPITKPLKETVVKPEKTIKSGESIDPQVHTMTMIENYNPLTFKTSFVSTVKYELSYGSTTKTVTVKFNYKTPSEKLTQDIIWNQFDNESNIPKLTVNNDLYLNAYATSGLPITYSVNSNIVKIEGNKLIALKKGEVIITAIQEGNDTYKKASISKNIQIIPATPIIRINNCIQTYDGENKNVTINTEPENLSYTIKYMQGTFEVAETINADVYYVTINVDTENYKGEASSWLIINKAPQIIIWNQEKQVLKIGEQIKLEAKNTTTSQDIEYYSEDPSIAEIIILDGLPYIKGKTEGNTRIMAHINGNNNYEESAEVKSFKIESSSSIKEEDQLVELQYSFSSDILTLKGELKGSKITLMDTNGNIILIKTAYENHETIDINNLNQGIYILGIQNKNNFKVYKIIK